MLAGFVAIKSKDELRQTSTTPPRAVARFVEHKESPKPVTVGAVPSTGCGKAWFLAMPYNNR